LMSLTLRLLLEPKRKEARAGIEPANSGFADRCLTTWLPRQGGMKLFGHTGFLKRRRAS
jgi:hypothetical protein